jgi:hypothetical protein
VIVFLKAKIANVQPQELTSPPGGGSKKLTSELKKPSKNFFVKVWGQCYDCKKIFSPKNSEYNKMAIYTQNTANL